jgi:hypothetical protein
MATQAAENLKKALMNAPVEEFEPLTFGELEEGKRFIIFPSPGDNHGHGGFRKAHWLFEKKENHVKEMFPGRPYSEEHPHGMAINTENNTEKHFPLCMHVILVG